MVRFAQLSTLFNISTLFTLLVLLAGLSGVEALLPLGVPSSPASNVAAVPSSPGATLLFQNDLDWATTTQQTSRLLLSKRQTYKAAQASCVTLSESLAKVPASDSDLRKQLSYLLYRKTYATGQAFWVGNAANSVLKVRKDGTWTIGKDSDASAHYPALCTQSAPRTFANETDTSPKWRVSVGSGPIYQGYRDGVSFRFGAIPFASTTERFTYSQPSTDEGVVEALDTTRNRQCPQTAGTTSPWAEQCLVLNLFTPYLPSKKGGGRLRPIFLWIHGGGFSSGSGLDDTFDGGLMASRGDVVVININYRLGSLGFLATGDDIQGNFGLGDVITALKWVKQHAAIFGGDASKVTVAGQSAGAQLVELLVGAPQADGLFHGAIVQSGRPADKHNVYKTPAANKKKTDAVVKSVGCDTAVDVATCLRGVPVDRFLSGPSFSSPVVDGSMIETAQYVLSGQGGHVNRVPMIIGYMRDEKASLGYVPPLTQTNLTKALTSAGVPRRDIKIVEDNPTVFNATTIQNLTVTVETNNGTVSRCGLSATAFSAATRNVLPRVWAYTQDQRAFQIPNYDPYGVCEPQPGAPVSLSNYYSCHSGDLLPTFATAGYMFHLAPRDADDVVWTRNQIDQWTSFVRTGDPNPAASYIKARGYSSVSGDRWPSVAASATSRRHSKRAAAAQMMSLGAQQRVVDLRQHREQCEAIGLDIAYIARGG